MNGARLILDILHKSLLIYNGTLCFARGVTLEIQAQQLPINELNETPLSFNSFIGVKGLTSGCKKYNIYIIRMEEPLNEVSAMTEAEAEAKAKAEAEAKAKAIDDAILKAKKKNHLLYYENTKKPLWRGMRSISIYGFKNRPELHKATIETFIAAREKTPELLLSLRYADLTGIDLEGMDLRNIDLKYAQLGGANLCKANLTDVNLKNAFLDEDTIKEFFNKLKYRIGYSGIIKLEKLVTLLMFQEPIF